MNSCDTFFQVITFLLCSNATLWAFDSFVSQSWISQELQLRFMGVLAWGVISRISLPLLVFYRFHSGVLLLEVWQRAYRTGRIDSTNWQSCRPTKRWVINTLFFTLLFKSENTLDQHRFIKQEDREERLPALKYFNNTRVWKEHERPERDLNQDTRCRSS